MQKAKDKECYEDFQLAIDIDHENPNIYHHRGQVKITYVISIEHCGEVCCNSKI